MIFIANTKDYYKLKLFKEDFHLKNISSLQKGDVSTVMTTAFFFL